MNIQPQISPPHYRYFNQSIELVPGWNQMKDQMVGHAKNSGLQWIDTTDCSCCEWDGIGDILYKMLCNNNIIWKTSTLVYTKVTNYKWIYNGILPNCDEEANLEIFCNADVSFDNCSSKWTANVIKYPCLNGPYELILITPSNISTFGFPQEFINSIISSPYWPNSCGCDSTPFWYIDGQIEPDCGCCPQ